MLFKNFGETDKKFVITRTYDEFLSYCKENGFTPQKDAIFLTSLEQVRGYHLTEDNIIRYGRTPINPEIESILLQYII